MHPSGDDLLDKAGSASPLRTSYVSHSVVVFSAKTDYGHLGRARSPFPDRISDDP